jgi:hypothetical protein
MRETLRKDKEKGKTGDMYTEQANPNPAKPKGKDPTKNETEHGRRADKGGLRAGAWGKERQLTPIATTSKREARVL